MDHAAATPPTVCQCPGCGAMGLLAVTGGAQVNLLCTACGSCWHAGAGGVERVDPRTCPGCAFRGVCTGLASAQTADV